jgi:Phytanoyl-CoA dioxygenase (PhyH)
MAHDPADVIGDDFGVMTPESQREYFGEHGFVVVPGAIPPQEVSEILGDIDRREWREREDDFWSSPLVARLVENPAIVAAVRNCYGPDVRFFKGVYVARPPVESALRTPEQPLRQNLHMDYSTAEDAQDFRNFAPSWVNVGIYFTTLTPDNGPLWVVPRSNRRYHLAPGPELERVSAEARMVLANAGDAVLFHCFTVHAGGYNFSDESRRALFLSYRPAWSQPPGPVPAWPDEVIAAASPERRRLLIGET